MMHPALPLVLLALVAPAAVGRDDDSDGIRMAQVTIRERVVVRVPRMRTGAPMSRAPLPPVIRWKEKKGPKCIAVAELGGAMISQPGMIDLVLTGGRRLRAKLDEDCPTLDFYSGFYLRPAEDGKVCGGRDEIRMRSGTRCGIKGFRTLLPAQ